MVLLQGYCSRTVWYYYRGTVVGRVRWQRRDRQPGHPRRDRQPGRPRRVSAMRGRCTADQPHRTALANREPALACILCVCVLPHSRGTARPVLQRSLLRFGYSCALTHRGSECAQWCWRVPDVVFRKCMLACVGTARVLPPVPLGSLACAAAAAWPRGRACGAVVRRRIRLRCRGHQRVPGGLRADRGRGGVPHRRCRRWQDLAIRGDRA
jgi:hypothetical protein